MPEPFIYKGVDYGTGGPLTNWPGRIVYVPARPQEP